MRKNATIAAVAVLTIGVYIGPWGISQAMACSEFGDSCVENGGADYTGLSRDETKSLPKSTRKTVGKKGKPTVKVVPYEYRTPLACPGNSGPDGSEVGCAKAFTACAAVEDAQGPMVRVFRRAKPPNEEPGEWEEAGETCWPKLVPNVKRKPELTVAMIKSQFVRTPFVKPRVSIQPVGNKTLVNLPTYFAADFSGTGYGPGEVRTVTILGHTVRIKPVLKSNTFRFGDGATLGPTKSSGGVYPTGDVRHTYMHRGSVGSSITTVYGGKFSVDGSAFVDLPGAATITGPVQRIDVLEAKARLVR